MADTPLFIPELGDKFKDHRRDVWGNSFTWSWQRPISQVRWIVIHHTVTTPSATADDIALLHKARGWGGIGYHFVVTKDGTVWYVGDIGTARAHVKNMNEKVLGVSLVGDFTKHLPSDEQIVSTHKLCKFMLDASSIPPSNWEDVKGHKELKATACPGTSWDKSKDGDMWWRIKTGTPYTPPPPVEQEDVYKLTYKGEEIARYEYNPSEKIKTLGEEIQRKSDQVAQLTVQVGNLTESLTKQEEDNGSLLTQVGNLTRERDTAKIKASQLEGILTARDAEISKLNDKIKALEANDPLSAYSGWELIRIGFRKLFGKGV